MGAEGRAFPPEVRNPRRAGVSTREIRPAEWVSDGKILFSSELQFSWTPSPFTAKELMPLTINTLLPVAGDSRAGGFRRGIPA